MIEVRILFFNRLVGCHVGGTETHIKELALRLAKRGNEVHIMTTEGSELRGLDNKVKVWYIGKNWRETPNSRGIKSDLWLPLFASIFAIKSLYKLIKLKLQGEKFSVISVHCALEGFILWIFKWIIRTPHLFVFEGYTDVEARIGKHSDVQIAISNTIANKCRDNYGFQPIVIPVGIDMKRFSPNGEKLSLNYPIDHQVVLGLGRLSQQKKFDVLIKAAEILSKETIQLKFLIVGDGSEKKNLQSLINKLDLRNRVQLVGRVRDEKLPMYYRSSDIFVNTEVNGGDQFWIVVVEAMSSGLPVIVTAKTGLPEVVGDAALWVRPESPELLAKKILEVASNHKLRNELAAKSLEWSNRFNWSNLIIDYEKAYLQAKNEGKE